MKVATGHDFVKHLGEIGKLNENQAEEYGAPDLLHTIRKLYNIGTLKEDELVEALNSWGMLGLDFVTAEDKEIRLDEDIISNREVFKINRIVPIAATRIGSRGGDFNSGTVHILVPMSYANRVTVQNVKAALISVYQTTRWEIQFSYTIDEALFPLFAEYQRVFWDTKITVRDTRSLRDKVKLTFRDAVESNTMDIIYLMRDNRLTVLRKYMNEFHEYDRIQYTDENKQQLENMIISIIANVDVRKAESEPSIDFKIHDLIDDGNYEGRVNYMRLADGFQFHIRIIRLEFNNMDYDNYYLTPYVRETMLEALTAQNGVILVTGPRGSGKQVFTYSTINEYKKVVPNHFIETLEDPVEAKLEGNVAQIEIDDLEGHGFKYYLTGFKRHSTTMYFIGELRDKETTEATINEAASSSLVISTSHVADCAGTMKKLDAELGGDIELLQKLFNEFLAITNLTMARVACPSCVQQVEFDSLSVREKRFLASWKYEGKIHKAKEGGCSVCQKEAYEKLGRPESDGNLYQPLIIVEGLDFDYAVRDLMAKHTDLNVQERELRRYMIDNNLYKTQIALMFVNTGMLSLQQCMQHFGNNVYTQEGADAINSFN